MHHIIVGSAPFWDLSGLAENRKTATSDSVVPAERWACGAPREIGPRPVDGTPLLVDGFSRPRLAERGDALTCGFSRPANVRFTSRQDALWHCPFRGQRAAGVHNRFLVFPLPYVQLAGVRTVGPHDQVDLLKQSIESTIWRKSISRVARYPWSTGKSCSVMKRSPKFFGFELAVQRGLLFLRFTSPPSVCKFANFGGQILPTKPT